jgi:hypothetical protein
MHHDVENAVDFKQVKYAVVSQNLAYGYGDAPNSDGTAIVVNNYSDYPKESIWLLFNEVRDSNRGIRCQDTVSIVCVCMLCLYTFIYKIVS